MEGDTRSDRHVFVRDVKQDVVSRCDRVPESESVKGGIVCHGYFDIEKLIFIRKHDDDTGADGHDDACGDEGHDDRKRDRVLLLEKKLPFQLLIVRLS